MKIADLFMRVIADDAGFAADLTMKAGKAGDKAGLTLGQRLSGGVKKASAGIFAGLGIGAGISAFGALDTAVSKTIGFFTDAVAAARADEESQNRLTASLKANVPAWDGNTKAIEANILAKQRLGFDDETLRDSLTVLVGATHDVTKAQEIQNTAMDLARFKGISLKDASEALIKVEGGVYRSLKQLGIKLRDGATATEALAAVQAVAAGQAEAYAHTSAGELLASQIALGEKMEDLGRVIMPLVTDAMLAVAAAAVPVVGGISDVVKAAIDANDLLTRLTHSSDETAASVDALGTNTSLLGKALHGLAELPGRVADDITGTSDASRAAAASFAFMAGHVRDDLADVARAAKTDGRSIGGYIQLIGTKAGSAEDQVAAAMLGIVSDVKGARAGLESAAQDAASAIYDPIIAGAERARIRREIAEQQQIISSKTSTREQVRDAQARMLELRKAQIANLATLASYGDASATAALKHQIDVLASTKNLTTEQKAELASLRAALRLTTAAYNTTAAAAARMAYMASHTKDDTALPGRAAGGYAPPGWVGRVGELGAETLHVLPGGGVWVDPHAMSLGGGSAGNTYNINVPVSAVPEARDPLAIARTLGRFARTGMLTLEPPR